MMALNRHRLKHLATKGSLRARTTQGLLAKTDQLLSVILIGNNLINTIIPVLTTSIALHTFGHNNLVLSVTTGMVAFLIIVFAEIAPKIVGATYPEKVALPASLILSPLMRVARPLVWFVNLFANGVLSVLQINTKGGRDQRLSTEELRTIVLESGNFMPTKHRSILLNLFDLENITVDDVMIPRRRIEALDFDAPFDQILTQLETCYHNKLVVYQGDIDRVLGVLHVRKTLSALHNQEFERETLRDFAHEVARTVPRGTEVAHLGLSDCDLNFYSSQPLTPIYRLRCDEGPGAPEYIVARAIDFEATRSANRVCFKPILESLPVDSNGTRVLLRRNPVK